LNHGLLKRLAESRMRLLDLPRRRRDVLLEPVGRDGVGLDVVFVDDAPAHLALLALPWDRKPGDLGMTRRM